MSAFSRLILPRSPEQMTVDGPRVLFTSSAMRPREPSVSYDGNDRYFSINSRVLIYKEADPERSTGCSRGGPCGTYLPLMEIRPTGRSTCELASCTTSTE
jgi:hypothetical protein